MEHHLLLPATPLLITSLTLLYTLRHSLATQMLIHIHPKGESTLLLKVEVTLLLKGESTLLHPRTLLVLQGMGDPL